MVLTLNGTKAIRFIVNRRLIRYGSYTERHESYPVHSKQKAYPLPQLSKQQQ